MLSDIDFSSINKFWHNDDSQTKFKLGQKVLFKKPDLDIIDVFIIKGVNIQDKDNVEYALEGCPILAWEEELEEVQS